MPRDPKLFLYDMKIATEFILEFTQGMDKASYLNNMLVRAAVERKFEIIGEALTQLSRIDAELADRIPHKAEIIGFRNILAHGYTTVDQEVVYNTIHQHLQSLIDEICSISEQLPKSE